MTIKVTDMQADECHIDRCRAWNHHILTFEWYCDWLHCPYLADLAEEE